MTEADALPPRFTVAGDYVAGDQHLTQHAEGDIVGRDKIVNHIQNIIQRALSAAEEAEQVHTFEQQRLAQGVAALLQRLQARAAEAPPAGNPYKGLLEYRLSEAEIFFGRQSAVTALLSQLGRAPLTVLQSESGAGKTSLLQAGLAPVLLASGHLPLYLRPYNVEPGYSIKRAFLPDLAQAPELGTAPLREFVRQVGAVLGPATTLYVCLDQFEEFFTQLVPAAQAEFARELADCTLDPSLNVRWLLALRSEYFGRLYLLQQSGLRPFENVYTLLPLRREQAREVVTAPAAGRGVSFEPGLVDQLLDDLGQTAIAPPQLQLVCAALFDELSPGATVITQALYAQEGGVPGILRGHLERVLSRDLPREQRVAARHVLEALVSSEQQRRRRTLAELSQETAASDLDPAQREAVLAQLVNSRLVKVEDSDAGAAYELAHDYLVGEIKLDPELQARKAAQELLEQELRAFRRYGSLLSAERLQVIEPYQAELRLTPDAQQLLTESQAAVTREAQAEEARRAKELDDARRLAESEKHRAEEQARSARRLRQSAIYLVVALVAALLLGSAAGVFGFRSNDLAVQNAYIANSAQTESARAIAGEQAAATARALADQRRQEAQAGQADAATAEAVANARRQEAQTEQALSRSRELAAAALNNLAIDPQLSLLLALQAEGVAHTLNADDALRQALQRVPAVTHLVRVPVGPSYVELATDGYAELTPDRAYLAAVDSRGLVWVWRAADGEMIGQVGRGFDRFGLLSNQELLVASQATGEVRVLTLPALAEARRLTLANAQATLPLRHVQLLGDIILGQNAEGRLYAWSVASGQELWATEAPVTLFRVSPPADRILARRVLIADGAAPVRIVDAQTGHLQSTVAPDAGALVDATLCPEGHGLVTVSADQQVVYWYGDGQTPLSTTRFGSPVVIAPDCRWLAANTPAGALRYTLPYVLDPLLLVGQKALRFSDDGRYLVADQQTWETASGLPARSPGRARLLAPDGQALVPLHIDSGQYVFSWADGLDDPTEPLATGETEVLRLRFSPNGQFLLALAGRPSLGATCCPPPPSGRLHIWDSRTRQEVFNSTDTVYTSADFTADGQRVLAVGADGRVYQWQVGTWQSLPSLGLTSFWSTLGADPIGLQVTSAQLSPRGDQLAVGTLVMAGDPVTPSVRLLDPTAQRALSSLDAGAVLSLQFSPDGQRLLTSLGTGSFDFLATGVGEVELWDLATSRLLATLNNDPGFANARFDPTGRAIATASGVGARLWDAQTGAPVGSICCHDDRINSVEFSPDGQRLVTASSDRTARVWDAHTGELLAILRGHSQWVTSAVFSPDGQWIVTGSEDGDLRWHAADTAALIRDAQAHVTRALSCDERKVYLAEAVVCPTPTPVVEHP